MCLVKNNDLLFGLADSCVIAAIWFVFIDVSVF